MNLLCLLFAAIHLTGVTGESLRARAFFDANNVKVGDPLVLTVDFLGNADFASLHPPALSRVVKRAGWKLDDASAKTDTYRDARRLTYRVRPMREGVLWFPELEFEYEGVDGAKRLVRSNAIPVHAKPGVDVVVAGMSDKEEEELPEPNALVTDPPPGLSDDDLFAWRKACANPTADAFAAFDFTEAKLNEARSAILDGDWRRAIAVYSRLEWRTGQTPAIEHGLVAALARKFQSPAVELPVWRQVGRPILRHGWRGRAILVFGGAAAFVIVFWLLGRIIRALACVALFALLALPAFAQMRDPFAGFNISFGGMHQPAPTIVASVATDRDEIQVGDAFNFVLSLEAPRGVTLEQIQMTPSEIFGMQQVGASETLPSVAGVNPSNIVMRIAVPVRYDVPFRGEMTFHVSGMATIRQTANGGRMSFTSSTSFGVNSAPLAIEIKPLPSDGQPAGFSGIIADSVSLAESLDLASVETNDVITITYRMAQNGYLPEGWMPQGAAFEWTKGEWRRYVVADGVSATPEVEVVYYDPKAKAYKSIKTGGSAITYR